MKLEDLPHLPNAVLVSRNELRASDNRRHYYALKKLTLDGASIHGVIENIDHMPALRISRDGRGILRKEDRLFGAVMIIFVLRFAAELFV